MKLVNTEGMALIGPGSEWFWTAISGIVLAITFIAIYRQLRLQRDAAAIAYFRDAIELEEALRIVTVRLTPTPIPVRLERAARAAGETAG